MLSEAELVMQSWKLVSQISIVRFWVKASILPVEMQIKLTAEFGKMSGFRLSPDKRHMEDILSMLDETNN